MDGFKNVAEVDQKGLKANSGRKRPLIKDLALIQTETQVQVQHENRGGRKKVLMTEMGTQLSVEKDRRRGGKRGRKSWVQEMWERSIFGGRAVHGRRKEESTLGFDTKTQAKAERTPRPSWGSLGTHHLNYSPL